MAQNGPRRISDKPPAVSLNLDKLEREGAADPFVLVLGGKPYEFRDAMDIDWQQLTAAMSNPVVFFKLVLDSEDAKVFLDQQIPAWKLRKLMDAYRDHYGLVEPGESPALST